MLFNENSVHFLNNGNPNKYPSTYAKIKQFKSFIEKNDIEVDKIIFNSSIVLSLYGLRECRDIDYLSVDNNFKYCDELIENHNGELVFHQEEKNELIFNKEFYFLVNLAIGGGFGGSVDPKFSDATFEVDYIRVYK